VRRVKFILTFLPIIFTAQACDLLLGGSDSSGIQGVFFSVDSGDSWQAGKPKGEVNLSGASVWRLFVEGSKPQNIIAASANQGLLGSDDHGATWLRLLPDFTAYDAFINPFNDREIFAAGSKRRLATIYKSPDRGATWLQVYNEPTGKISVTVLAFDRSDSETMYAGLSTGTILKSVDRGDTWNSLMADFDDRVVDLAATRNVVYSLNLQSGLHRSVDGGRTWTDVDFDEAANSFNDLYVDPASEQTLSLATNEGLYRSTDSGQNWSKLPLPASPEVTNVTAVDVNPSRKSQIFAGIKSTVYRSDDNGANWRTIQLPTNRTISSIVIDPFEPNRIYTGLR